MRIDLVKRAVKNLAIETLPNKAVLVGSFEKFREDISDALGKTQTVYVVTFWHVDSISGFEWNIGLDDVAYIYSKWVHELDEAECAGVVGLFEVKVPHSVFTNKDELHAYIEDLEAENKLQTRGQVLDSHRIGVDVSEGF